MKKAKKIVALLLCAVLLIGASVAGTLAFLTAQTSVTNTFTVGSVKFDAENALDEAIVNEYGVVVTGEDAGRTTDGNEYKLIPGHTYTKDPTIHILAGSEDCYLFVKVENGIAGIEAANVEGQTATTIAGQMAAKGWTQLEVDGAAVANVYCKAAPVETEANKNSDVVIFESFTIATGADVSAYGDAEIVITAYAVQADGFDSAAEAWTGANFS